MKPIRVVWKDSSCTDPTKVSKYRGIHYRYTSAGGWVIDYANDRNIYRTHYSAQNAIDKHLGGHSRKGKPTEKRLSYGIQIIGQLPDSGTAQ